jgi:uncharacterized protein (UPF0332 family)
VSVRHEARALLDKAARACASARLLLQDGDIDGACNRAYYGMFDAARAALQHRAGLSSEIAKTHSGLITAFGLHLVKPGLVSPELGKALNRALEIRLIADYRGESVESGDAETLIGLSVTFIQAMQALVDAGSDT